jgi:anti-sigma regulatory factor (Ser/Thr protein kinase)/PAS domain-containing protein
VQHDSVTLARDALRAGPVAQVVVDGRGDVVVASRRACDLLGSTACAAGRPLRDGRLREMAVHAAATGEPREARAGSALAVNITPLPSGATLTFTDAAAHDTRHELRQTVAELASLSAQLHASNAHLRAVSDDLDTATTELEDLNDELRRRSLELAELDETLHDVVRASGCAALVADREGRVCVWTREAAALWSVPVERAEGRTLAQLGFGDDGGALARAMRDALASAGSQPVREVQVQGPHGARLTFELHAARPAGDVVIFMRPGRGDSSARVLGHSHVMASSGSHAFELRVPAIPASVGELRHALSAELEGLPVPAALVEDIGLAVSEAATNAVLHAYLGDSNPGTLVLSARVMDDRVHVVVRDHGRGMTPRPDSPGLGLGLPLMTRLADAVQISTHPDGGTEVRMTFTVSPAESRPRFAH